MNMLYCSLDLNEFNLIFSCISIKQIWDKLEGIYKGANQEEELYSKDDKDAPPNLCLMGHAD